MNPYTYSANCSWHGPIAEVGKTTARREPLIIKGIKVPDMSLPCCPFCGSVLFQVDSVATWNNGALEHERKGHANYVEFLNWTRQQSRCWPSLRDASKTFEEITGKEVVWDLPTPQPGA